MKISRDLEMLEELTEKNSDSQKEGKVARSFASFVKCSHDVPMLQRLHFRMGQKTMDLPLMRPLKRLFFLKRTTLSSFADIHKSTEHTFCSECRLAVIIC